MKKNKRSNDPVKPVIRDTGASRASLEEFMAGRSEPSSSFIGDILERGPSKPVTADLAAAKDEKQKLLEGILPTNDEVRRAGELLNAFFGEFNSATRSYAYAKNMDAPNDQLALVEAFMENPAPDVEPEEIRRLGWQSFEKLTHDLSMPVHLMEKARAEAAAKDAEDAYTYTDESIAVRDKKVVPILREYEDAHGLFDIGTPEAERQQDIIDQVPGYAMVVQAMMHDNDTRGLRAAIKKKAFEEPLTDKEQQMLTDYSDVVDAVEGVLASAGLGYATAPCNQVHRASSMACKQWADYMREAQKAVKEYGDFNLHKADVHFEEAMKHHHDALQSYKAMREGLAPVCELVENAIDTEGTAQVDIKHLESVKQLVSSIPELAKHDKISYNAERIAGAVERVYKFSKSEIPTANDYRQRSHGIDSYANTTQADADKLIGQIEILADAVKQSGGEISISDHKFRDVYMGIRALNDRMEMMQTAAEQLHTDMGYITKKQKPEWLALETDEEKKMFAVPEKPSDRLKKVAEEIQRNCTAQHEVAVKCRSDLTQALEGMGGKVDRFDIAHDFFARLRETVQAQIDIMEPRQAMWDKAHPGAGKARN